MRRQRGPSFGRNTPEAQGTVAFIREYQASRPVKPSPLAASALQDIPLDLLERIRAFPLFARAPDSFLARLGAHLKPQVHAPRENILTEGDEAKAMYWLVRGGVVVTTRDMESTFAELKPGAFFGEIGILLDIPRTANVVATHKTLVLRLNKEDLGRVLPDYPEIEQSIRHEAAERLAILDRKKSERQAAAAASTAARSNGGRRSSSVIGKRTRDESDVDSATRAVIGAHIQPGERGRSLKKRKSPSPALIDTAATSVLSSGTFHIRNLLTQLPLFRDLPADPLHFLGMNAEPHTFPPFTTIIEQGAAGREVYFITEGAVEVFKRTSNAELAIGAVGQLKARLGSGQYFGEIYSLQLAPRRTASVRSVTAVECLVIRGEVLEELWSRCSPRLRQQMEATARQRLDNVNDEDIKMHDGDSASLGFNNLAIVDAGPPNPVEQHARPEPPRALERGQPAREPFDPDPFRDADKAFRGRASSRRASLANLPPEASPLAEREIPRWHSDAWAAPGSQSRSRPSSKAPDPRPPVMLRPKLTRRQPSQLGKGIFPDSVLVRIFQYLDVVELMRLRQASWHWSKLLTGSREILRELDLSAYGRKVTDAALIESICPFVGDRPRAININNCFHITDDGFIVLVNRCGANAVSWKMKSVWDISAQAVVALATTAKSLEEIDFSNCRKISDNLLGRIVGWTASPPSPADPDDSPLSATSNGSGASVELSSPVLGCPNLARLTLSYCKHISDRSMAHLAAYAASRLEHINLTRCTSVSDHGFALWADKTFPRLRSVVLADCTYLSDNAILCLTRAAPALEHLDLSFCCALSDGAVEIVSRNCRNLLSFDVAFCGSAVSDTSLQGIAAHLKRLQHLSVRGCVRVTGLGVEALLTGCPRLRKLDVSQCKNLTPWLDAHEHDLRLKRRHIRLVAVADGKWRVGYG